MSEFLYVVEFDSGVVKVGRGQKAKDRIRAAECIGIIAGWVKINEFSVECLGRARKAEAELIAFASKISKQTRAREWFVGADFVRLTNAASEFASKDYADSYRKNTDGDSVNCLFDRVVGANESNGMVDQEKLNRCIQMAEELHEIVSDLGCTTLLDDDYGFNGFGEGYIAAYALFFYVTDDIDALLQCRKIDDDQKLTINIDAVIVHFYSLFEEKGLFGIPLVKDAWMRLKNHIESVELAKHQVSIK